MSETQNANESEAVGRAASAVERLVMLPEHPCYVGDSEFDHDLDLKDDSFDHEYGVELIQYYECRQCGLTLDLGPGDYDPFTGFDW